MLDFKGMMNTPDMDMQIFSGGSYSGNSTPTQLDFQTWHKPSGARMIFMIGIGGGGSGGWSSNTANSAGGGGGGGVGSQVSGFMPAMYFPDTVYIATGRGGIVTAAMASTTLGVTGATGSAGVAGTPVVVTTNPGAIVQTGFDGGLHYFMYAQGSGGGGGGGTTTGGAGGVNAATQAGSFWSKGVGRIYGQGSSAGSGGVPGANGGAAIGSVTGSYGGCGGGGSFNGTTVGVGGQLAGYVVNNYWPTWIANTVGGAAASGSTPAGTGQDWYALQRNMQIFGASGGGGDSNTAGGQAGNGGQGGGWGVGGGGAGGSTKNNALAIPGCGGDGAFIIWAW